MPMLQFISRAILWLTWGAFLISFFLPAYGRMERPGTDVGTPLLGWQAMVDSLIILTAKFWILFFEPRFALLFLAPLGNFFVLFVPFLTHHLREECWPVCLPPLVLCISMWFLPGVIYEDALYGFWIWNLSTLAMAIAVVLNAITMTLCDGDSVVNWQNKLLTAKPAHDPFDVS